MEDEDESRIILPPPVVREIIDKTAGFVVKNGRAFETRIASSAQGNTLKFAFLAKTHPYQGQTLIGNRADQIFQGGDERVIFICAVFGT